MSEFDQEKAADLLTRAKWSIDSTGARVWTLDESSYRQLLNMAGWDLKPAPLRDQTRNGHDG